MIDFFHKGASMTKRISGVARLKGAPEVKSRPPRRISRIGTFLDEEDSVASILLEVADTEESRRHGLMGRKDLPAVCGMLFEGLSGGGYFWMKGCLIPLDIAFMDKNGIIVKICTMEADGGKEHHEYDENAASAVEVKKGFFKKHGIVDGFKLVTRELRKESENG